MSRTRSRRRPSTPRRAVPMLEYLEGRSLLTTTPTAFPMDLGSPTIGLGTLPVPIRDASTFVPATFDGLDADDDATAGPDAVPAPEDVAVALELAQALTDIKIIGGSSVGAPTPVAGSSR